MKKTILFIAAVLCPMTAISQIGTSANSTTTPAMQYIVGTIYVKMENLGGKQAVAVTNNKLMFSPNPVKDYLSFNKGIDVTSVIIFDISGKKVLELEAKDNAIDVSALSKGVYVMVTNLDPTKGYQLLKE